MFPPGEDKEALDLSDYYDATSAAGDDGHYKDYSSIMELYGQDAERSHYVGVRQATRQKDLMRQQAKVKKGITELEKYISEKLEKGDTAEKIEAAGSPFVSSFNYSRATGLYTLPFLRMNCD